MGRMLCVFPYSTHPAFQPRLHSVFQLLQNHWHEVPVLVIRPLESMGRL